MTCTSWKINRRSKKNAHVTIKHCDIKGGKYSLYIDPNSSLDWDQSNVSVYPGFVKPGYWQNQEWHEGDYQLSKTSLCIDLGNSQAAENLEINFSGQTKIGYITVSDPNAGEAMYFAYSRGDMAYLAASGGGVVVEVEYQDPNDNVAINGLESDFAGNQRRVNSAVDIGAIENQQLALEEPIHLGQITLYKANFKVGKTNDKGNFRLWGSFEQDSNLTDYFQQASTVNVQVGPFVQSCLISDFRSASRKNRYEYVGSNGGLTRIIFDFDKNIFCLKAKNAYLTGLTAAVSIEIGFGGFLASGTVDEDIINEKDTVPRQFMMSFLNFLEVTKCNYIPAKNQGKDCLIVRGQLALENPNVDLTKLPITITWGEENKQEFLEAGSLKRIGKTSRFILPQNHANNNAVKKAYFDLKKCLFMIVIKKSQMDISAGSMDFGLSFGDFDESETILLP